jgi:hypothetical protein
LFHLQGNGGKNDEGGIGGGTGMMIALVIAAATNLFRTYLKIV